MSWLLCHGWNLPLVLSVLPAAMEDIERQIDTREGCTKHTGRGRTWTAACSRSLSTFAESLSISLKKILWDRACKPSREGRYIVMIICPMMYITWAQDAVHASGPGSAED